MDVYDFDREHLESVLKDEDQEQLELTATTSVSSNASARRRQVPSNSCNDERDSSKERYALLPDYARESFVQTSDEMSASNEHAPLSIQDTRGDVEDNLPEDIKTVGAFLFNVGELTST